MEKVDLRKLIPAKRHTLSTEGFVADFASFIPLSGQEGRTAEPTNSLFSVMSLGTNSNHDSWTYGFDQITLVEKAYAMLDVYEHEAWRWAHRDKCKKITFDSFALHDESKIKWSSTLKQAAKKKCLDSARPGKCAYYNLQTIYKEILVFRSQVYT